MKFNKIKSYYCTKLLKPIQLIIFLFSFNSLKVDLVNAEYLSEDLQIDSSTKTEEDRSIIPSNPFEVVEMIRRYNSLNDATNPSDALDDAIKSFNSLEEK